MAAHPRASLPADGRTVPTVTTARPRVVIVGVGHAGLEAAKALKRALVDVLLVDRHNYHKFQPLLYQVATAGLQPGDITQPARHVFRRQQNLAFLRATVTGVDPDTRLLLVDEGPPIPYDFLILGAGASTAYYGVAGAEAYGFPLKNIADAVNLRSHVLLQFEEASRDPALVEAGALTFAIVGGGPTGVEMAGALRELFDRVLRKDFPALDVSRARVILLEAGDALLTSYKPHLRDYTRRQLEKRGVEVRLNETVVDVTPEAVRLRSGEAIPTRTLVWAAGVRANPLADRLGLEQARGGRITVDATLRVPGHPGVFVAGDMAGAAGPDGALYPQVAQVAMQQGVHAAREVERTLRGEAPQPFRYRDKGQMATIGRNAAVLELPNGWTATGWLAWIGWVLIHIVNLAGFRNKLGVFVSWVYNYFTYDRGPRLISPAWPETDEVPVDRGPWTVDGSARPTAHRPPSTVH
jgi:NADH dehydrogenase